jgi:hypothetical protein
MNHILRCLPVIIILFIASCKGNREVTVKELQSHIRYLASDSLKGRFTGSEGDSLAAEYIKAKLASYGFSPLSGDGFQRFSVTKRIIAGKSNYLSVNGTGYTADTDFMPFSFSSDAELESEVVFAGYGFSIKADSLKWDDYDGAEVNGKWVLVLRGDPEPDNNSSPYIPFSSDRGKALLAKDNGAAGVLMVSGPGFDPKDAFEPLNTEGYSVGIPVLRIKREVADAILSQSKNTIAGLEKTLNDSKKPF